MDIVDPAMPEDQTEGARAHLVSLLTQYSVRVVPKGEEFTLSSGEKSRVYCDLRKTALRWDAAETLAILLLETASRYGKVEAFAGVALGGCHLASIAAFYSSGASAIHVRKEAKGHGTKRLVEAPDLPKDARVVLVEDVTTTAGSALKALEALKSEGYNVVGVITVVDRRGAWSLMEPDPEIGGVPISSIVRIEELVKDPEAC